MRLIIKKNLPGTRAHTVMVTEARKRFLGDGIPADAMESAVLVPLSPTNQGGSPDALLDWTTLLIRRNRYPGVHSGQISFPGGKIEDCDEGLWQTACRETLEEVGIEEQCLERIGSLTNVYVPASNFVIHPFLALNGCGLDVVADPREVVDYKHIPLKVFDPAKAASLEVEFSTGWSPAPGWQYEDFTIWGATAMILAELHEAIVDGALVCE